MTLKGRHAVVTGASRGIGAAIARALLDQGARVTALARDADALQQRWAGVDGVRAAVCDVTDEAAVGQAFSHAQAAFGVVDILVNNAGAASSAPFGRTDADAFRRLFEVNVISAVHCTQAVLPGLKGGDYGRIVNIASVAGLRGYGYISAYAASKHALVGLTRSLAAELAATAITVNAVCPGFTDTEMVERSVANITAKTGRAADVALEELTRGNPQKRLIQPDEVAAAVAWLCAPQARGVSGHCIAVDGGETA